MGLVDKQTDLINDAYENFGDRVDEMWQKSGVGDLDDFLYDGLLVDGTDENGKWFARLLSKEEFTSRIKTDEEFAQKWGLKIGERELSLDERNELLYKKIGGEHKRENCFSDEEFERETLQDCKSFSIPTKLTTITYNGQTQEKYE